MKLITAFILVIMVLTSLTSFCQDSNNSITGRLELMLDSPSVHASTKQANVEANCINKSLTNKCLIYHNDLWFTFTPPVDRAYFLNVTNQQCTKKFGVQVVILEGDPCETKTYRIKKCIGSTSYKDFYVKLDSVIANQTYLVNIDGYLEDQCDFNISFETSPRGTSLDTVQKESNVRLAKYDSIVSITWNIDSLNSSAENFLLTRKFEREKEVAVATIQVKKNAVGKVLKNYAYTDTLHTEGNYIYSLWEDLDRETSLLWKKRVSIKKKTFTVEREVSFSLQRPGNVFIYISDASTGEPLTAMSGYYGEGTSRVTIDFTNFFKAGIKKFKVTVKGKNFQQEETISIN